MMKELKNDEKAKNLFDLIFLLMTPFIAVIYLIFYLLGKDTPTSPNEVTFTVLIRTANFSHTIVTRTTQKGDTIMITVKGTMPDTEFTLELTSAKDAEGSTIPVSDFNFSTPVSDNLGAVEILEYDASTRRGRVKFGTPNPDGSPNIANITANVLNQDGSVAVPVGEQVAVVAGDVVSFEGGFRFEFPSEEVGGTEPSTGTEPATPPQPSEETESGTENNG